ncbi:hypothetical protein L4C36_10065 [Photobacterium japonica]|uniref:hypothetical protein n=1 Tax=Photobacterium japonica TaxID=2910235 RepID=UPI003D0CE885
MNTIYAPSHIRGEENDECAKGQYGEKGWFGVTDGGALTLVVGRFFGGQKALPSIAEQRERSVQTDAFIMICYTLCAAISL